MQIKETIIKEKDLKMLMEQKGIRNLEELANVANVKLSHLERCARGYRIMGDRTWQKIKLTIQSW